MFSIAGFRSFALGAALVFCASAASAEQIKIGGVTRTFTAQLPDTKPAPLVIALHGNTQTGADMMTRTSWPDVAKREHFAVVFPDGLNRAWADFRPNANRAGRAPPEGTDDIAFIVRLIEKFIADGTADPKRIYVTGVSNGGAMTMTLVCARADLFAAAASVIMNLTDESARACHPSRPVPMLMMNGTADPLIPYQGGRGTSRFADAGFLVDRKDVRFLAPRQCLRYAGCDRGRSRRSRQVGPEHGDADFRRAARRGATSCSIASTTAATACPAVFRTPVFRARSTPFWARKTATSTAPRRSGGFSGSFRESSKRSQWRLTRPRAKKSSTENREDHMTIQRFDTGPRMSQVVIHGDTIYLAGVVASNVAGESVTRQTQDVLSIIDGHLKKAGSDKSKLLTATIYLTDMKTFAEMNAVWDGWVSPGNTPARATVEAKLASPKYSVEIMVAAAK